MPPMWQSRLVVFKGLHEKFQVKAIAKSLGRTTNEVVGALLTVWFKFQEDGDSEGNISRKAPAWLDVLVGCDGFAEAMAAAGWLRIHDGGLTVANFDEFISKAAVRRQENTLRRAGSRAGCAGGDGSSRDNLGTTSGQPRDKVTVAPDVPVVSATAPKSRKKGTSAMGSPLFDRFWAAYPRKEAKAKAAESFAKLGVDEELLGRILAAVGRHSRSEQWVKDNGQFIPHPATWLNQRRWEDEPGGGTGVAGGGRPVHPVGRVSAEPGKYASHPRHIVADSGTQDPPDAHADRGRQASLFPLEDPEPGAD